MAFSCRMWQGVWYAMSLMLHNEGTKAWVAPWRHLESVLWPKLKIPIAGAAGFTGMNVEGQMQ